MCRADPTIPHGDRRLSKQWPLHSLKIHMTRVHGAKARARRRRTLQVDGLGYVRAKLFDQANAHVDLSALTRFQKKLLDLSAGGRPISRLQLLDMKEDQEHPERWVPLRGLVPAPIRASAYKLAQLAGVSPQVVLTVLLAYGMEKVADELRRSRSLTDPHLPQIFPKKDDAA